MFAIRGEFNDLDHFSEVVEAWDLEFYQTGSGPFSGYLAQLGTPQAALTEAHFSRALEQNGSCPPGMRTFAIPAKRHLRFRWHGHEIHDHHIMVFPQGGELFSLSPAGFEVFTFSIHESLLHTASHSLGYPEAAFLLERGTQVIPVERSAMDQLLRRCRFTFDDQMGSSANAAGGSLNAALCEGIAPLIVRALAAATPMSPPRLPSQRRSKAIAKAKELVCDFHREPLTVKRICEEAGVSARTLEYAFQETFGMAPKPWLMARSLNHARSGLRRARGRDSSVADVANDWGFWHMGQFAADYRRMFGELPSETLGRTP